MAKQWPSALEFWVHLYGVLTQLDPELAAWALDREDALLPVIEAELRATRRLKGSVPDAPPKKAKKPDRYVTPKVDPESLAAVRERAVNLGLPPEYLVERGWVAEGFEVDASDPAWLQWTRSPIPGAPLGLDPLNVDVKPSHRGPLRKVMGFPYGFQGIVFAKGEPGEPSYRTCYLLPDAPTFCAEAKGANGWQILTTVAQMRVAEVGWHEDLLPAVLTLLHRLMPVAYVAVGPSLIGEAATGGRDPKIAVQIAGVAQGVSAKYHTAREQADTLLLMLSQLGLSSEGLGLGPGELPSERAEAEAAQHLQGLSAQVGRVHGQMDWIARELPAYFLPGTFTVSVDPAAAQVTVDAVDFHKPGREELFVIQCRDGSPPTFSGLELMGAGDKAVAKDLYRRCEALLQGDPDPGADAYLLPKLAGKPPAGYVSLNYWPGVQRDAYMPPRQGIARADVPQLAVSWDGTVWQIDAPDTGLIVVNTRELNHKQTAGDRRWMLKVLDALVDGGGDNWKVIDVRRGQAFPSNAAFKAVGKVAGAVNAALKGAGLGKARTAAERLPKVEAALAKIS